MWVVHYTASSIVGRVHQMGLPNCPNFIHTVVPTCQQNMSREHVRSCEQHIMPSVHVGILAVHAVHEKVSWTDTADSFGTHSLSDDYIVV